MSADMLAGPLRKMHTGEPGNQGQFSSMQREGSGMSLHGEGAKQGSVNAPPDFRGWTAEEYIEWWEQVPIADDGQLKNIQHHFIINWKDRHAEYCSAACDEWEKDNPRPEVDYKYRSEDKLFKWKRELGEIWDAADARFREENPVTQVDDSEVRLALRAYRMFYYSGVLASDEEREKVDNHQVGGRKHTVRKIMNHYPLGHIHAETYKTRQESLLENLNYNIARLANRQEEATAMMREQMADDHY